MNKKSRSDNTILNSLAGMVSQLGNVLLNFIVRMVFVRYLNEEYLGVNGLFSNILTVLSLAELGVGNAIIFNLYKPIAENNKQEIAGYMNLYRKAYICIGTTVFAVGMAISPFLDLLIKDTPDIPHLTIIYYLFLANTTCSYFFAYKKSMFTADQRDRVVSQYRFYYAILKSVLQCIVLIVTKNFIVYLIIQVLCTFLENCTVSIKADKCYPFLKKYKKEKISKEKLKTVVTNVKATMIYKIGGVLLDGTDNIILSMMIGVTLVGKLSNYTLIVTSITMVMQTIISSLTASIGNFIAKEDRSRHEDLLNNVTFISFVFYGFSFVCLASLMTPFVELAFGAKYVLNTSEVFVIALNFYIIGMMNSVWMFRSTMGLFVYGKYRPLVSAGINIVVSVLLAKQIGLLGVLLGTTISRFVTNVWFDPYIVYKYGLNKKPTKYYLKWMKYLIISIVTFFIVGFIFNFIGTGGIFIFVLKCVVSVSVVIIVFCLFCFKTSEFKVFINVAQSKIKSLKSKIK